MPSDPMPERIVPMLAKLSKLPRDDGGWAYEIKWDGVRAIAYVAGGSVRLESRNLNDVTPRYPEVGGLAGALGGHDAVLDGEVVAFDEQGRPSFERLQGRMHLTSGVEAKSRRVPVVYCAFDLVWLDGENLMRRPYTERRALLEGLKLDDPALRTPAYSTGNGGQLLEASAAQGLEGIICKRLDSPYEPGRRGGTWLKVKNTRRQELVIGGWLPGEGRRAGHLGALIVGYYDDGSLRYAGKVGTGFNARELDRLQGILTPLRRDTSPFDGRQPERGSTFVEPELVAEIEFTEWTSQNMLRHPSYKGLRDDKRPLDVVLEKAEEPTATAAAATSGERAPLLRTLVGGEPRGSAEIEIDDRAMELTGLDKVIYPATGFTKGEVIDYYLRIAPVLLPHVQEPDAATIVERVDAGALELHTPRPDALVFEAARTSAPLVRALFAQLGLETFPKTAGDAIQVHVPLNTGATDEDARGFGEAVAEALARSYPRSPPVDWSRNAPGATLLAPYSLCAGSHPAVSMPVAWDEVESSVDLVFDPEAALARVDERGDLFAPVLTLRQELPSFD